MKETFSKEEVEKIVHYIVYECRPRMPLLACIEHAVLNLERGKL